ncbi:hypothetical protein CRUP_006881 [Coryphaenoides rupestris]|nr:hypothetical protein CRUP_006881 [Coryphaenoides rupestris]
MAAAAAATWRKRKHNGGGVWSYVESLVKRGNEPMGLEEDAGTLRGRQQDCGQLLPEDDSHQHFWASTGDMAMYEPFRDGWLLCCASDGSSGLSLTCVYAVSSLVVCTGKRRPGGTGS